MLTGRSRPFVLVVLALTIGVSPQIDAQRAVFRSGVAMVPLTVTVTDGHGKYVNSLTDADFTILEDGIEQPLTFFASEHVAIDLALMLDVSASMGPNMPLVQKAARGLVRSLRPQDRAAVIAVRNSVGISQALTTDRSQVEAAIQGLTASGDTALYDGVYVMLKELARARVATSEIRKQVLVVLSDGLDTVSRLSFEDVKDLAARVGVNIYVISLPQSSIPVARHAQETHVLQAEYAMKTLARETGGRSFFPKTIHELPTIYAEIGDEIANQYELGYLPSRPVGDRGFRRVAVRVENAIVRTRTGYYADSGVMTVAPVTHSFMSSSVEPRER